MPRHSKFSPEFKAQRVLEVLTGAKTAAEVCREYQLKPDLFARWKANLLQNAAKVFQGDEQIDPAQARIAELERLVGRLTLELEIKKSLQALGYAPKQKRAVIGQLAEEYPVSLVCEVLRYPRSSYYHAVKGRDDTALKVVIQDIGRS